ncbi:hypothetical protein [Paraburkholderia sp. EG304]|uniref:hypothetical protein n=1 Tax=Paraburkholderia sp. EG304 TaxID=3237015 RepID=UPI00397BCE61
MKLSGISVAAAAAAFAFVGTSAYAQAQATADTSPPVVDQNTLTAVGGSPRPQSATGAPIGKTRDQVRRETIEWQHDPEAQRREKELFNGGQ